MYPVLQKELEKYWNYFKVNDAVLVYFICS